MISLKSKKNILWDFDGVIMDSMAVRDRGFEVVLEEFPEKQVEKLMEFHRQNGGLSRYVKFRYFFEDVRKETATIELIDWYAGLFSKVMLESLIAPKLLIEDSLNFIKREYKNYCMHIVSGSDQKELRHICRELEIDQFFHSIHGSPIPKKQLVKNLIKENEYKPSETILIGDSINDYEAAEVNNLEFYGYNNPKLENFGKEYIEKLS